MVMLEAEHTCMTMRGIKKPGSKTITTITRGQFKEDRELRNVPLHGKRLMDTMIRVNQIWKHPIYQEQLQALQMLEADRKFCRHTPEHFLDVARLAYIHALESHASASKELIYCTALLHDIGRAEQYRSGIPHDEAGAQIAEQILRELSFDPSEIQEITSAIREHRNAARSDTLSSLIYDADKASRNCFSCPAEKECYWSAEKKNLTITY